MNNDEIRETLLFCTSKNILNCILTCKQINSIDTPYFWKLLCERLYNVPTNINKFLYKKRYRILNDINKVAYIVNIPLDKLLTQRRIIINSDQLFDISKNTEALKNLTFLKIIYVRGSNSLNTFILENIRIQVIRQRKISHKTLVNCGDP